MALMPKDPGAIEAFHKGVTRRRAAMKETYLYLGRVLPTGDSLALNESESLNWLTTNVGPLFEAGLRGTFWDATADNRSTRDDALMNAQTFGALGRVFGGNAVPVDTSGLDAGAEVGPERIDDVSLHAYPCFCVETEVDGYDPRRRWSFGDDTQVMLAWWDNLRDPRKAKLPDAILDIRARRAQGYVVGLIGPARPEIELEILTSS
jgi:hypothetical protein